MELIAFIIGAVLVITFFVMAYRLRKIIDTLEDLRQLEIRKPENRKLAKCEKCGENSDISVLRDNFKCPKCKKVNYL